MGNKKRKTTTFDVISWILWIAFILLSSLFIYCLVGCSGESGLIFEVESENDNDDSADGQSNIDTSPSTDADGDSDSDIDTDMNLDTDDNSDPGSDLDVDSDGDLDTGTDTDNDAGTDVDSGSDLDTDIDTDTDTDTDSDSDSDTDADSDTDTDIDSDGDSDTESDIEEYTCSIPPPELQAQIIAGTLPPNDWCSDEVGLWFVFWPDWVDYHTGALDTACEAIAGAGWRGMTEHEARWFMAGCDLLSDPGPDDTCYKWPSECDTYDEAKWHTGCYYESGPGENGCYWKAPWDVSCGRPIPFEHGWINYGYPAIDVFDDPMGVGLSCQLICAYNLN